MSEERSFIDRIYDEAYVWTDADMADPRFPWGDLTGPEDFEA